MSEQGTSAVEIDWAAYADELGRRLAAVRRAQGITQIDLAHAAGVDRNQVQNIENSRTSAKGKPGNTTLRTLFLLAAALGVPPALLIPSLDSVPGTPRRRRVDLAWPTIELELLEAIKAFPPPDGTRQSKRVSGRACLRRAD